MFGSMILEVGIGLVFTYLLLSLVCTSLNELLAGWRRWRAHTLKGGIDNLLGSNLSNHLYKHPLVKGLSRVGTLPSYIPSETFALALLDIVTQGKDITSHNIKLGVADLTQDMQKIMLLLLADAGNDLKTFRERLILWHCTAMDRVSGWYKRKTQGSVLVMAILLASAANADTILLAKALANSTILRESIVAQAESFTRIQSRTDGAQPEAGLQASESAGRPQQADAKEASNPFRALRESGLPLGWLLEKGDPRDIPRDTMATALKVLGLAITIFAVSLGAPFWFDLLNKIVMIRSAGKSPAESGK
jgi:hypothetical protein